MGFIRILKGYRLCQAKYFFGGSQAKCVTGIEVASYRAENMASEIMQVVDARICFVLLIRGGFVLVWEILLQAKASPEFSSCARSLLFVGFSGCCE